MPKACGRAISETKLVLSIVGGRPARAEAEAGDVGGCEDEQKDATVMRSDAFAVADEADDVVDGIADGRGTDEEQDAVDGGESSAARQL